MLVFMRTTINLPDALAEQAKARAAEEGRTFTSLVEQGLRTVLDRPTDATDELLPLPTSGRPMGPMLIDITDKDALYDLLDREDGWI
jgi:hypothetical protein